MGLHCLPRSELLKVHRFRLFSCFKLAAWQNLIRQDFKKDMKKKISWNFRLSRGQPSETFSLPPANSTREGQLGNCLFLTLILKTIHNPDK